MESLIDRILYDKYSRYQFNRFVRGILIFLLVFVILITTITEIRPYTGNYNNYISINGFAYKKEIDTLQDELDSLPDWVLKEYVSEGNTIILNSKPIKSDPNNQLGDEIGSYQHIVTYRVIYLNSNIDNIKNAALHEFGHFLDDYYGTFSDSEKFIKCYDLEKKQFLKIDNFNYNISTQSEYFAECFLKYIKQPKKLKKYCPQTYEIMEYLIKNKECFSNKSSFI